MQSIRIFHEYLEVLDEISCGFTGYIPIVTVFTERKQIVYQNWDSLRGVREAVWSRQGVQRRGPVNASNGFSPETDDELE